MKAPPLFHRDSFINRGDKAHWEIAQEDFEKWWNSECCKTELDPFIEALKRRTLKMELKYRELKPIQGDVITIGPVRYWFDNGEWKGLADAC